MVRVEAVNFGTSVGFSGVWSMARGTFVIDWFENLCGFLMKPETAKKGTRLSPMRPSLNLTNNCVARLAPSFIPIDDMVLSYRTSAQKRLIQPSRNQMARSFMKFLQFLQFMDNQERSRLPSPCPQSGEGSRSSYAVASPLSVYGEGI